MQFSPEEIKEKLLSALDQEHNVTNMDKVVEVISTLEKYNITREALERTRIGKYVNEMRRKTGNKDLSKRAKDLVKKWRVLCSVSTDGSPAVNGEYLPSGRRGLSPALTGRLAVKSGLSPALSANSSGSGSVKVSPRIPTGRPLTPGLRSHNPGSRPLTPALRPMTPGVRSVTPDGRYSPALIRSTISPSIRQPLTPNLRIPDSGVPSIRQPLTPHLRIPDSDVAVLRKISPGVQPVQRYHNKGEAANDPGNHRGDVLVKPRRPISPHSARSVVSLLPRAGGNIRAVPSSQNKVRNSKHKSNDEKGDDWLPTPASQRLNRQRTPTPPCGNQTDAKIKNSLHRETSVDKTNVANRKRTRSPNDLVYQHSKKKIVESESGQLVIPNGDVPWLSNRTSSPYSSGNVNGRNTLSTHASSKVNSKTYSVKKSVQSETPKASLARTETPKCSKVKTTAQLIAELKAKSNDSSIYNSDMVSRIESNMIEKEIEVSESIVPPGAKPRPRRAPGTTGFPPAVTPTTLNKTKSEMIERFLQSSALASGSQAQSPLSNTYANPRSESPIPAADSITSEADTTKSPPTKDVIDPYSLLPPLNLDDIDWEDDGEYVVSPEQPVTETLVDRVHTSDWEGVNGTYDSQGTFRDWTQVLTTLSFEQDPLHILPYVDINE